MLQGIQDPFALADGSFVDIFYRFLWSGSFGKKLGVEFFYWLYLEHFFVAFLILLVFVLPSLYGALALCGVLIQSSQLSRLKNKLMEHGILLLEPAGPGNRGSIVTSLMGPYEQGQITEVLGNLNLPLGAKTCALVISGDFYNTAAIRQFQAWAREVRGNRDAETVGSIASIADTTSQPVEVS